MIETTITLILGIGFQVAHLLYDDKIGRKTSYLSDVLIGLSYICILMAVQSAALLIG